MQARARLGTGGYAPSVLIPLPLSRFKAATLACAMLMLAACSSISLDRLPFSGTKERDTSRPPDGASAYLCEGGNRLFVRFLDNGAAAWVILPEREFRLNRTGAGSATRYSNGADALELEGQVATLFDGPKATHSGCKLSGG
jgi:membrane-bound inhibitor of C-type lysozyme